MSFTSLRAAIKTKLETLVGANEKMGEVLAYNTDKISKYPAATFEPTSNENAFFSNADNLRSYSFDIFIHQEMQTAGRDKAIEILAAVVDDAITAFDTDFNLGGACDFCLALPSDWGEYTGATGAIKYAKMTLICKMETQVII